MSQGLVYPELVTGRADGFTSSAWRIERGSTWRGDASCDLSGRILRVPWEGGERARVVRAHELVHVRVSPHRRDWGSSISEVSPRALECAEEMRVNTILARLGFAVELLRDGSERVGGERLAASGDWAEAVCFLLAVVGTGAERDFMSGVRRGDASWTAPLRAVAARARTIVRGAGAPALGATEIGADGLPAGYGAFSVPLARLVTSVRDARVPRDSEELRRFRRSLLPGGRRPPSGHFAPLCFASTELRHRPRSAGVRRVRPSVSGSVMRFPSRLLTDDQRRAFVTRSSRHGGVVVIDQSGSMDIEREQLEALVRAAPDSLVVGYSHRPGDDGSQPNAWVLAQRGGVVNQPPSGNVGNGVDGPILRWAIRRRRVGEPLIWVTDGQVTDSADHPDEALARECAQLVRAHSITMVRSLGEVSSALRGRQRRVGYAQFGRVGRALGSLIAPI